MHMRCKKDRLSAAFLAALVAAVSMTAQISAAAPSVNVDESVYVSMDYYGEITDTSIVKGCDLNGNDTFTDYGAYDRVTNMSNHAQPKLAQDSVTWKLDSGEGRFYYECKPKNTKAILPWQVDVSYSLNGTPIKAEKLAGASGLVQVDIHVTPNEQAGAYYRNNMMLVAATLADMESNYSFRADGAQMQTIGSKKMALFMALPGQEANFSYQIGTDSFESIGTVFLMAPATLSQLDDIQEIKDAKERIQDASDALNASMDILLDSIGSLSGGLRETQAGLEKLDEARQVIYDSRDGLEKQNKKVTSSLTGLSNTLRQLAKTLDDNQDELESFADRFDNVADSMAGTSKGLRLVNRNLSDMKKYIDQLSSATDPLVMAELSDKIIALGETLSRNASKLPGADSMQSEMDALEQALAVYLASLGSGSPDSAAAQEAMETISGMLSELRLMQANITTISAAGGEMTAEINDLANSLGDMRLTSNLVRVLSSTAYLMDNLSNMDQYITETIKDCEDLLNDGLAQTTAGLQDTLENAANAFDQTGALRQHKDTIKQTIEDEWDRLDEDLGILNIDTGAEMVSFTSDKNPNPGSIQIIMRTQEISIDDTEKPLDVETSAPAESVWDRIANLFIKIWNAILSIFQ